MAILWTNNKKITMLHLQLLQLTFAAFCIILLFFHANGLSNTQIIQKQTLIATQHQDTEKQILALTTQKEGPGFPLRLKIPKINVDAAIEYMGITSDGEMGTPSNTVNVGWFALGTRPGEKGSAVIAGHLNNKTGEEGVFNNLHKLQPGDKLYIEYAKATSIAFVVREIREYNPGYADDVFSPNDKPHLNLITCDGLWDEANKTYSKRLVVFADITH